MADNTTPTFSMKTSLGDVTIKLDEEKAPKSVENFKSYVKQGFYDGTIFHRVIDDFMVQCGGFTGDMDKKKTGAPIPSESKNGLKNKRGSLAMARTKDPDSATSQFFINVVDNTGLDHPSPDGHGYSVFGEVTEGLEVVDKIRQVKTVTRNGHADVPDDVIIIESIRLVD